MCVVVWCGVVGDEGTGQRNDSIDCHVDSAAHSIICRINSRDSKKTERKEERRRRRTVSVHLLYESSVRIVRVTYL